MVPSETGDSIFRRRLMQEVSANVATHFSFYSPSVKVQLQREAERLPGANGRYIGNAVTIEFVPQDAAAVERVREFVWDCEQRNEFTGVRRINHLRRCVCPHSVEGLLERVRGVDRRAAARAAGAISYDEAAGLVEAGDAKTLAQLPGIGEKRAREVVGFYANLRSGEVYLYTANRNDRFRGEPVVSRLDLTADIEGQAFTHAEAARALGEENPLGYGQPPGHTTVRDANLLHPLPMTPSLMGRSVFHPEQVEIFADKLRRVLVEGERLAGVEELRIQRGKVFHLADLPGVGQKTRSRVLASGLLDHEYTYENLRSIPGVTQAQARTIAGAAEVGVR